MALALTSPPIAVGDSTAAVFALPGRPLRVNVSISHYQSEVGRDLVAAEDGSRTITASGPVEAYLEDLDLIQTQSKAFDAGIWLNPGTTKFELELGAGASVISLTSVETVVTTGATHYRYIVEG